MKPAWTAIAALAITASAAMPLRVAGASCQLRVGTFNIRCICKSDKGARSWGERRGGLADYANKLKCDVIGFQEVTPKQLDFLKLRMSDYAFVATFRERNRKSGEARIKGMEVIAARLEKVRKGASVVLVGDYNCTDNDGPAVFLRKRYDDAMFVSRTKPKGPWRSFTGWGKRDKELPAAAALKMQPGERDKVGGNRIDYIYVSRGVRVSSYETFTQKRKGTDEYFSDHQPVVADITVR